MWHDLASYPPQCNLTTKNTVTKNYADAICYSHDTEVVLPSADLSVILTSDAQCPPAGSC